MTICQAVEKRIKELLSSHNMSQYRLERKCGLSHETLKNIMRGKTKGVNLRTLIIIADGFDMSICEFLNTDIFLYDNLVLD